MRLPTIRLHCDPPRRISAPRVSRYASTTHCCSASPPPRSFWIDGSATLTTVESTKTIVDPRMHAARISRLRVASPRWLNTPMPNGYTIKTLGDVPDAIGDYQ